MTKINFQVRRLIWSEIGDNAPKVEIDELRRIIGDSLIESNKQLHEELSALAEILNEFQQQNDSIREKIQNRPRLPESQDRVLLRNQIKLLLKKTQAPFDSSKDQVLYEYITTANNEEDAESCLSPRMLQNMHHNNHAEGNAFFSRRPMSSASTRPVSRGSESRPGSAVSAPSVMENISLPGRVSIEEIDAVKEQLRWALKREQEDLMSDIEFVQDCVDMENDLIVEDRKKANGVGLPSMTDLRNFSEKLEKMWIDKEEHDEISELMHQKSMEPRRNSRRLMPISTEEFRESEFLTPTPPDQPKDLTRRFRPSPTAPEDTHRQKSKANKIRSLVQDIRDEEFLT